MVKTIKTIEEIRELLEKENYCGFRNLTDSDIERIESGEAYLECSHEWNDGEMLDELLPGTCAVYVDGDMENDEIINRYNQALNCYEGSIIALIGDRESEWGNDENEIIIGSGGYGANVLAIVLEIVG